MFDTFIKKLESSGRIKKQKVGIVQVEALLKQALLDLQEAGKIVHLAERATHLLSYVAMLKAGQALLFSKGYRPAGDSQHKTIVEVTEEILGEQHKHLTAYFERIRRKRNELVYDTGTLLSPSEAKKSYADAISFVQQVVIEVKAVNPGLELKL